MLVLGIETATARGSVAIVGPLGVVGSRAAHVPGGHLEWLIPAIDEVLAEAGIPAASVDALAASAGPGGFSGLRIGLVTAAAWAVSAGRPVVEVSTLETVAAGVTHRGLVLAALDARRGEVAAALFRVGGEVVRLTPDLLARPDDLRARLPAVNEPVVIAGDALDRHGPALVAALAPHGIAAPAEQWWPRAEVVAALGRARLLAGDRDDPLRFVPHYVRAPDAREFPRQDARRAGTPARDQEPDTHTGRPTNVPRKDAP